MSRSGLVLRCIRFTFPFSFFWCVSLGFLFFFCLVLFCFVLCHWSLKHVFGEAPSARFLPTLAISVRTDHSRASPTTPTRIPN